MINGEGDSILEGLILENRNRIAVYERACRELQIFDINYQVPFRELSRISKQNIAELELLVHHPSTADQNGQPSDEPFTGFRLENILAYCERAEIKIRDAYNGAIHNKVIKPYLEVIQRHQQLLGAALQRLNSLKTSKQ